MPMPAERLQQPGRPPPREPARLRLRELGAATWRRGAQVPVLEPEPEPELEPQLVLEPQPMRAREPPYRQRPKPERRPQRRLWRRATLWRRELPGASRRFRPPAATRCPSRARHRPAA